MGSFTRPAVRDALESLAWARGCDAVGGRRGFARERFARTRKPRRSARGSGPICAFGQRVRPGDGAEPARARLRRASLGQAVDGDQAERRAVAEDPLEVVEQAPVDVAAYVDAGREAGQHAGQRSPDVLDALG